MHKQKGKQKSRLIKFFRRPKRLITFAVTAALAGWFLWTTPPPTPLPTTPATFFANQCDDDLRAVFLTAVGEAHQSIDLTIYSLTEPKLIKALQKKADEDIPVRIVHDPKTNQRGFAKLGNKIEKIGLKTSGLMHKKILVVDKEAVWISSANWTRESLRLHDNLVVALHAPALAHAILAGEHFDGDVAGQHMEFWDMPTERKPALKRVLEMLETAQKTIQVAMFTWTHGELTQAIIDAHERGVEVEVVVDRGQANVGKKALEKMSESGVPVRLSQTEMCHHKFALIDGKTLLHGSANWTGAAFSKNHECILIIHDLSNTQRSKMRSLWHAIHATSSPSESKPLTLHEWLPLAA